MKKLTKPIVCEVSIIKRNYIYLDKHSCVLLYKAMVRPQLKYANYVWSHIKKETLKLLKSYKKATKLIIALKLLPYIGRLKQLLLLTLKYRRLRLET